MCSTNSILSLSGFGAGQSPLLCNVMGIFCEHLTPPMVFEPWYCKCKIYTRSLDRSHMQSKSKSS